MGSIIVMEEGDLVKVEEEPPKLEFSPVVQPIIPRSKVATQLISRLKREETGEYVLPVCSSIE